MGRTTFFSNRPGLRIGTVVLVTLIAVYAVIGFLVLPWGAKHHVLPRVAQRLDRPLTVTSVRFNPFTLTLGVDGLELSEPDGSPLLGLAGLRINFQSSSIIRRAWTFAEIQLTGPRAHLVIQEDGRLNLAGLAPPAGPEKPEPAPEGGLPAVWVQQLRIHGGHLSFRDLSGDAPFETEVSPIALTLTDFSTEKLSDAQFRLRAAVDKKTRLSWDGTFSVDPVTARGNLSLAGLELSTWWAYCQAFVPFGVADGQLGFSLDHDVRMAGDTLRATLSDTRVDLEKLAVAEKGGRTPLISLAALSVKEGRMDWGQREIALASVTIDGLRVKGVRDSNGALNLQALIGEEKNAAPAPTPPPETSDKGAQWRILLPKIVLADNDLVFEDHAAPQPVSLRIFPVNATLTGLAFPAAAPWGIEASLGVNNGGVIALDGQLGIAPLDIDLDVKAGDLALAPFQPYLASVARIGIAGGNAGVNGHFRYRADESARPALLFKGDAGIRDLAVTAPDRDGTILGWKALSVEEISFQQSPNRLEIARVNLTAPHAAMTVYADGQTTLSGIFPPDEASVESGGGKADGAGGQPVTIGAVTVENAGISFVDQSVAPHFTMGVQELNGGATNVVAGPGVRADLSLAGKVDGLEPLSLKGRLQPPGDGVVETELTLIARHLEMTRLTPYFTKYVGRGIRKGKLSLDLRYTIAEKKIRGDNSILLDQFTLGEKTESPDALNLPVGLAIALLKDRQGKIDIELPVAGDLNDPEYKFGGPFLKALTNLVVKAAASPFSILGSLVGGNGEALKGIRFEFGDAALGADQKEKLDKIVTVLAERPGLGLEIQGAADPEKDRWRLAEDLLSDRLRELNHSAESPAPEETAEATELIRRLYRRMFEEAPPEGEKESLDTARQRLLFAMPVTTDDLRALAHKRATKVKEHLVHVGKVPDDRLYLVDIVLAPAEGDNGSNVALSLVGK